MSFLNEIVWCLTDILATASPSICPPKLTNHSPLLSYVLVCPYLLKYERERFAGAITIDVHQGFP